jgi:ribosome-binding protein aMBF1 (putative translation factor)
MSECDVCRIEGRRLFDCISNSKFMQLCGKCVMQEHATLIEKPTEEQIRNADNTYSVYQRLAKEGSYNVQAPAKKENPVYYGLRKELESETPASKQLKLVKNFPEVLKQKMSERQITSEYLAMQIGIHLDIIKAAEKGFLKDMATARKLEQFFGISFLEERKIPLFLKNRPEKTDLNLGSGVEIDFKSKDLTVAELKAKTDEVIEGGHN